MKQEIGFLKHKILLSSAECMTPVSVHTLLWIVRVYWQLTAFSINYNILEISHANFRSLSQHLPTEFQFKNTCSQNLLHKHKTCEQNVCC